MANLFMRIFSNVKSMMNSFLYEARVEVEPQFLEFSPDLLASLQSEMALQLQPKTDPDEILPDEKRLVSQIQEITAKMNRNNVTRTEAYRRMYFQFPELHWAFLAHMVSRNGGWHMTDLKGDLLPHLLSPPQAEHFFNSFERANALIFQDAYPQLLLYENSKKRNQNLFHLLPALHVSRFMLPVWNRFWSTGNSQLLTVALIVNEQNYIEKRVVRNPVLRKNVYDTLQFKAQSFLQLTQVIFPFYAEKKDSPTDPRLAGVTLENFTDTKERIAVGKNLYCILFGIKEVFEGARSFAHAVPHTGSRADYWPHIFSKEKQKSGSYLKERLVACTLQKGAPPFYSPELTDAWTDQPIDRPERFDWFTDLSALQCFRPASVPSAFDMTNDFCVGLNTVELGVLAKEHMEPQGGTR